MRKIFQRIHRHEPIEKSRERRKYSFYEISKMKMQGKLMSFVAYFRIPLTIIMITMNKSFMQNIKTKIKTKIKPSEKLRFTILKGVPKLAFFIKKKEKSIQLNSHDRMSQMFKKKTNSIDNQHLFFHSNDVLQKILWKQVQMYSHVYEFGYLVFLSTNFEKKNQ